MDKAVSQGETLKLRNEACSQITTLPDTCSFDRPTKRRRVTFGASTAVSTVDSPEVITNADRWYSRIEIQRMKKLARANGSVYRRQTVGETDVLGDVYFMDIEDNLAVSKLKETLFLQEFRGLELYGSDQHCFSRNLTRLWVKSEVLVEQARQTVEKQVDPVKIAVAYRKASSKAVRFARILGALDESSR